MITPTVMSAIIIPLLIGFISSCLGAVLTVYVLKERVDNVKNEVGSVKQTVREHAEMIHQVGSLTQTVDKHEEAFTRVVWRDTCTVCGNNHRESQTARQQREDERYQQLYTRIERVEETFRQCISDLIKELKK